MECSKAQQTGEIARLSAVISELQRDQMKHDVPRLGGSPATPVACDATDAAGLLRIVEAQASDLVYPRRALVSAQAMAAERFRIILAAPNEVAKALESPRSIILSEIKLTQDAISDVIDLSRWRRIGQRLGLARRLAWETSGWRTDLTEAGSAPESGAQHEGRRW